jgi:hypothetical protein
MVRRVVRIWLKPEGTFHARRIADLQEFVCDPLPDQKFHRL